MRLYLLISLFFISIGCHVKSDNNARKSPTLSSATINNIDSLTEVQKVNLCTLGHIWGFIKYYHSNINTGSFNMDDELFKMLPKILAAKDREQASLAIENWVNGFGIPSHCWFCRVEIDSDKVIQFPDYSHIFDSSILSRSLIYKLEYIKNSRSNKKNNYYLEKGDGVGNAKFKHEIEYGSDQYPEIKLRMLALFKYWNMIQYFYPYRHLMKNDWNKQLENFILPFYHAKNALEYQLACTKLVVSIQDTHADIWLGAKK